MTKKLTIAALTIAAALLTISAGAMAATALVERTPAAGPNFGASQTLNGFTVMAPALAGGPSATDYYSYYDSDGPNLVGIIHSYDDYSRYADARGVAVASVQIDSSLGVNLDDPMLTRMYGPFDYMFSVETPDSDLRTAAAGGNEGDHA
jgi:hypothetical protein